MKKSIEIDKSKTVKWRKLCKDLGEFCWTKKHSGDNSNGLFEVTFDNGALWQKDGYILAADYDGTIYLNMEADVFDRLPKAFAEHVEAWGSEPFGMIVWPSDMP